MWRAVHIDAGRRGQVTAPRERCEAPSGFSRTAMDIVDNRWLPPGDRLPVDGRSGRDDAIARSADNARGAAVLNGNLVAQTTDSHHAELDVLRPGRSRTVWWGLERSRARARTGRRGRRQ